MKTERIGLYGGTFAPPHLGHRYAVETLAKTIPLDRILIMPTAVPPHKTMVQGDSPEHRLAMCRLAFEGMANVEVSDYEIRKGGISYTVETLEYLTKPGREILLLCGSDMLLSLDNWRRSADIFAMAEIVCVPRYEADREELLRKGAYYREAYGARVRVLSALPRVVSSTEIRERVIAGGTLTEVLPDPVAHYVLSHGLYREAVK